MAGSKSQVFTVIVVSDHSQAVRKFRLPRRWLMNGGYAAAALEVIGLVSLIHYFTLLGASASLIDHQGAGSWRHPNKPGYSRTRRRLQRAIPGLLRVALRGHIYSQAEL